MTIVEKEIRKEIARNVAMQAYLKEFSGPEVKDFLSMYVHKKSLWLNFGHSYVGKQDEHFLRWITKATRHLEFIQQKKLFDLQCQWRAEKLQIPGVQITTDFRVWEHNILNCPFLEPVSREDIELYAQFLVQENPDTNENLDDDHDSWQEHDEIIEAYTSNGEYGDFPDWYDFYNDHRGTGVYMELPDIRGQKEEVYINLAREQERKENNYKPASEYEKPKLLPYMEDEHFDWFVKTFESKQVKELYTAWQWHTRTDDMEDEMSYYLDTLMEAEEPVPMPAHYSWQEAIKQAANSFVNKKIAEALPEALEQYLMKVQMNIAVHNYEASLYKNWLWIKEQDVSRIIRGRKLSGEPEDLNF